MPTEIALQANDPGPNPGYRTNPSSQVPGISLAMGAGRFVVSWSVWESYFSARATYTQQGV
jgi:hypothetical protein